MRFAPPTPLKLGALLPDLEILELVGHGGMGVVYKARQKRLDRWVALKILSPEVARDPAFAERFAREARAMAMLSHPHIVAVYDFGQTRAPLSLWKDETGPPLDSSAPGDPPAGLESRPPKPPEEPSEGWGTLYYFLMEYVDGLSLRQLLESQKLSPEEALAIVPQICDALQYAHDCGVVHRDIKPANILLDKRGQVKIADFGIAKLAATTTVDAGEPVAAASDAIVAVDASLTGAGQLIGTRDYMAPEQMESPQSVDHRADLYSLGVVFYQMLTDELPTGQFAPPSRKVQLDVRIDEIVLRALEKLPERRYGQASEIRERVETVLTGSGKKVSRVDRPAATPPALRAPHSWPRQSVSMMAIALPLVALLAYLSFAGSSPVPVKPATPPQSPLTGVASQPVPKPAKHVLRTVSKPPFEARLPNGTTVELVGVAEYPSQDRPWWQPDGSPLASRPYRALVYANSAAPPDPHRYLMRELFIRVRSPLSPGPVVQWWIVGQAKGQEKSTIWTDTRSFAPWEAAVVMVAKNAQRVSLRLNVSQGEWTTLLEHPSAHLADASNATDLFLDEPVNVPSANRIDVRLSYASVERNLRLLAIDHRDAEHLGKALDSRVNRNIVIQVLRFEDLQLDQVKLFRLQTQPAYQIEFRNVSLHPGLKTGVQVITPDIPG